MADTCGYTKWDHAVAGMCIESMESVVSACRIQQNVNQFRASPVYSNPGTVTVITRLVILLTAIGGWVSWLVTRFQSGPWLWYSANSVLHFYAESISVRISTWNLYLLLLVFYFESYALWCKHWASSFTQPDTVRTNHEKIKTRISFVWNSWRVFVVVLKFQILTCTVKSFSNGTRWSVGPTLPMFSRSRWTVDMR